MKHLLFILLFSLHANSSSLLDTFKLNKINSKNDEISEKHKAILEKNALALNEVKRKFKDKQYLEVINIVNNNTLSFTNKQKEDLLLFKLKSMHKLKNLRAAEKEIIRLDSLNMFTGLNVAQANILLAKIYLDMNKFTRFKTQISILSKNFDKNKYINENIKVLNAWYNLKNKNYNNAIKLCEEVLVNSEDLDLGSEAAFILAIVKKKVLPNEPTKFIGKIAKFNPDFFVQNNTLVEKNIDMFTSTEDADNNLLVLEKAFPLVSPSNDFKTFKKFSLAIADLYKFKKEWPKALEYYRKLKNHVGDLKLLRDETEEQIRMLDILSGNRTLDYILEELKDNKKKLDFFLVFKLIQDLDSKDYAAVLENLHIYEEINSKIYKKHNIINSHQFINEVYFTLFKDYLYRLENKLDTSLYSKKFINQCFTKIKTKSEKLIKDVNYENSFLETLDTFEQYYLNDKLFEKYSSSPNLEKLKTISRMLYKNNNTEELLLTSLHAITLEEVYGFNNVFPFYKYLVHIYKFNEDKLKLKSTYDLIIRNFDNIEDEEVLTVVDTYFTFLNDNKPFGEYTDSEITNTIYNYLSVSSKFPDSKLNKKNDYYFLLVNKQLKKNSYNELKILLDRIVPLNDIEKSKLNYFYMLYYQEKQMLKELEEKRNSCTKFEDNDWKDKCIKFK